MSDFQTIINTASGAVLAGTLAGPLKSLENIWYGSIGYRFDLFAQKKKIQMEQDLEKYKEEIANEVIKIPKNNIVDPKLSVVGPALEASKYYIDEEVLRKMFARLIANSMNKTSATNIHPAFVEFIKQMTSIDAHVLNEIHLNGNNIAIVKYREQAVKDGYKDYLTEVPATKDRQEKYKEHSAAIINLTRLGLIRYTYKEQLLSFDYYQTFLNSQSYKDAYRQARARRMNVNKTISAFEKAARNNGIPYTASFDDEENIHLSIIKGVAVVTPLGINFIKTCL